MLFGFFFFFKTITLTLNFSIFGPTLAPRTLKFWLHTCSTDAKFWAAHLLHAIDAFLSKFLLFQARSLQ